VRLGQICCPLLSRLPVSAKTRVRGGRLSSLHFTSSLSPPPAEFPFHYQWSPAGRCLREFPLEFHQLHRQPSELSFPALFLPLSASGASRSLHVLWRDAAHTHLSAVKQGVQKMFCVTIRSQTILVNHWTSLSGSSGYRVSRVVKCFFCRANWLEQPSFGFRHGNVRVPRGYHTLLERLSCAPGKGNTRHPSISL